MGHNIFIVHVLDGRTQRKTGEKAVRAERVTTFPSEQACVEGSRSAQQENPTRLNKSLVQFSSSAKKTTAYLRTGRVPPSKGSMSLGASGRLVPRPSRQSPKHPLRTDGTRSTRSDEPDMSLTVAMPFADLRSQALW